MTKTNNKKEVNQIYKSLVLSLKSCRGAMTLPIVLIISAILSMIAISVVFVSTSLTNTSFNSRLNIEAYNTALTGAEDGIMRVIRFCPIVSASQCDPYTISINGNSANVSISSITNGKAVLSVASMQGRVKRVMAELAIDQETGEAEVKFLGECYTNSSIGTPVCL